MLTLTTNETLRIFDAAMHIAYAAILLFYTAKHPGESIVERTVRVLALLCSLFLASTVWQYGRTQMFWMTHNVWQGTVVLSAYFALRKP